MIIPRISGGDDHTPGPAWTSPVDADGKHLKPVIKCRCGWWCGIGLHHVHADGRVTASFYHTPECDPGRGCGFHELLELADYDLGEFLPETKA